jgi:Fe2+ transport system protein FeoA
MFATHHQHPTNMVPLTNGFIAHMTQNTCNHASDKIKRLWDLNRGQKGWIASFSINPPQFLRQFFEMGLSPNTCVDIIQKSVDRVIFSVNQKEFAMDSETASRIYVCLA